MNKFDKKTNHWMGGWDENSFISWRPGSFWAATPAVWATPAAVSGRRTDARSPATPCPNSRSTATPPSISPPWRPGPFCLPPAPAIANPRTHSADLSDADVPCCCAGCVSRTAPARCRCCCRRRVAVCRVCCSVFCSVWRVSPNGPRPFFVSPCSLAGADVGDDAPLFSSWGWWLFSRWWASVF